MQQGSPPRGGLRAVTPLLVGGFAILFVVVGGGIDTVSVFLNALSEAEGWSRRSLSAGISVGVLTAGLATPATGLLIDRFGVRVPMTIGLALLGLGFVILSRMTEPWHFAAANLLLGPGFAASAMLPITVAVTVRTRERTALALGIVGVGASIGALVLSPALQFLVDRAGWRAAYTALGTAIVLTPLPFLLFALPRGRLHRAEPGGEPSAASRRGVAHDLLRREVGLLAGILIVPGLVSFGIAVHLVPYLGDLGHSATFGATALGFSVGVSALGKLAGGVVGDRIGPLQTLRLALIMQTMGVLLLGAAGSTVAAGLFVVVHGIAVGTEAAVVPVLALMILGRERFATLFGILQLASTVAIAVAPILPGIVSDATGSYGWALVFWIVAMGLSLLIAFRLRSGIYAGPPAVEESATREGDPPQPGTTESGAAAAGP